MEDLDNAIDYQSKGVTLTPLGHADLPTWLNNLGRLHWSRFEYLGIAEDIHIAIQFQERSVHETSTGDDDHMSSQLNNLAVLYESRFRQFGRSEDLASLIHYKTRAVSHISEDFPDFSTWHGHLGILHLSKFKESADLDDINKATEHISTAIISSLEEDEALSEWLCSLSSAYGIHFKKLGHLDDADKAIDYQTQAIAHTPESHIGLSTWLNDLGAHHWGRFRFTGQLADVEKAIEYHTAGLVLIPKGHTDLHETLHNLGTAYWSRFDHLGNLDDLERAIEYQTRAVSLAPEGHSNLPHCLNNLGISYESRFRRLGALDDLKKAIEYINHAVLLTPEDNEDLPARLNNLAISHGSHYERFGNLGNMDKAIELKSRAIELTAHEHPEMSDQLSNLGNSYTRRFEQFGRLEDINKAVEYETQAISISPENHAALPNWLNNLGVLHCGRFQRLGNLDDIDKAITYQTRAVALTSENHLDLPDRLVNLGSSHHGRFERLNRLEDIDLAVAYMTRAVSLAPEDQVNLPAWLNSLAISHLSRFRRLGNLDDISESIKHQTRAVALTSPDHPDLPSLLNNLGVTHHQQFQRLEQQNDIESSILHLTRAVALIPTGHADAPSCLTNLGVSYECRYMHLNLLEDIEKAINFQSRAVELTPPDHPNMPSRLNYLAASHYTRFKLQPKRDYLLCALDCYLKSSLSSVGHPSSKFRAARNWGRLASSYGISNPIQAYQVALDLVPQLVWLGDSIGNRYDDIREMSDLAVDAASIAIERQEFSLALEWLEQARSVVWNQTLQLRTPLDHLCSLHPNIADSIQRVAKGLQTGGSDILRPQALQSDRHTLEEVSRQYRRLAEEYEKLILDVRELPGFEDFLSPMKASKIIHAAQKGPVVMINCHQRRCDALVLIPGRTDIMHIPLPDFSYEKAKDARVQIERSLRCLDIRERSDSEQRRPVIPEISEAHDDFESVLSSLWVGVVKPVLESLEYTKIPPPQNLPHITYGNPGNRLSDFAISSYTPNLSALISSSPTSLRECSRIAAIGQEATPGQSSLPGTIRELESIERHTKNQAKYTQLVDTEATTEAVLDAMEKHDWVHLACHAHQNIQDPSESGFFLHNGVLSLTQIRQRAFRDKGLAFLSACQTAMGDANLPDEVIHLASGMLTAGYPSVIGTMWPVMDSDAPFVADKVYSQLLKDGNMDWTGAAKALHYAIGELRVDVGDKAFARWVPYIYLGI